MTEEVMEKINRSGILSTHRIGLKTRAGLFVLNDGEHNSVRADSLMLAMVFDIKVTVGLLLSSN